MCIYEVGSGPLPIGNWPPPNMYISVWELAVPNGNWPPPICIYQNWERAAPNWELAAPNFSSVKFIVQIVAIRNAFGLAAGRSQLGAGRSQRQQTSFCSVFSHEYIYPCLLHEITNQRNPNLKDNSSINVLLMC